MSLLLIFHIVSGTGMKGQIHSNYFIIDFDVLFIYLFIKGQWHWVLMFFLKTRFCMTLAGLELAI